jgi:hypothetical protein
MGEMRRAIAGDETPNTRALGRLPDACRNYGLWALARRDVGTKQNDFGLLTVRAEAESDGRAGMPEPDLRSVDSMPVGALAFLKQEVDRSNCGTCNSSRQGNRELALRRPATLCHRPATLGGAVATL